MFCRVPKELRFPYLASLQYVGPLHDDFVFRCTAIILSSKQLLTTSICVGSKERENPNSVVLGVSDMRGHIDEKLTFQLKVLIDLVTSCSPSLLGIQYRVSAHSQ